MKKCVGTHFYINIKNFDEVILDELKRTSGLKHAIHALDTYFSQIEAFGKKYFPEKFVVEKITGARLHMYVLGSIRDTYNAVLCMAGFAKKLADYFKTDNMPKYKTLLPFEIQVGACHGEFYDFEFKSSDAEERTTIGTAANYAAKIQECCREGEFAVTRNILINLPLPERKLYYGEYRAANIDKYLAIFFYKMPIKNIVGRFHYTEELEKCREYASRVNFTDMNFRDAQEKLKFHTLSRTECKRLRGIPLFADIRGSTAQLSDENDLEKIAEKYQETLEIMYRIVKENNGIHVQFQGDREFALFQDLGDHKCFSDALKTGIQMINTLKNRNIPIGIGLSSGEMYAAKIGAREEKDFLLIGKAVIDADENEDEYAWRNQIVISDEIYKTIREIEPQQLNWFQRAEKSYGRGYYYKTTV